MIKILTLTLDTFFIKKKRFLRGLLQVPVYVCEHKSKIYLLNAHISKMLSTFVCD